MKLAVEAFGVSKSTIYRWIKNYKSSNNNPELGKEKIKVLLDELCKQHNIPTISVSSIGNIIKMLKEERKLNHEYTMQLEKLKRKQR